jgi:hypothetical protein
MNIKAWLYLIISICSLWFIYTNYISLNEYISVYTNKETIYQGEIVLSEHTTREVTYTNIGVKPTIDKTQFYATKLDVYNMMIHVLNIVICLLAFCLCFPWYIEETNIRLRDYFTRK